MSGWKAWALAAALLLLIAVVAVKALNISFAVELPPAATPA